MKSINLFRTLGVLSLLVVLGLAVAVAQGNFTNSGTFTNTSGVARFNNFSNGAAGVVSNAATMQIRNTLTQGNATITDFDTRTGTVEFVRLNGAQTIPSNVHSNQYGNLAARNGGTKTLGGSVSVAGTVRSSDSLGASNVLDISTFTLTVSGAGTPVVGGASAYTFATGTVDYAGTSAQAIYVGSNYGTLTLSGAGPVSKTATGSLTVTSAVNVGADNTLDVAGGANTFTATGATFSVNATGTIRAEGAASFDAGTTIGGLFEYYGTSQAIGSANYTDLTMSGGSGTKTFGGTTRVAGTYSVSGHGGDRNYGSVTFAYNGSTTGQTVAADDYDNATLTFENAATKTFETGTTTALTVSVLSGSGLVTVPATGLLTVGTGATNGAVTVGNAAGLTIASTGQLTMNGNTVSTLTVNASSLLTNNGTIALTNTDVANNGSITNTGTITVD